jgi:hypothetical protein
LTDEHHVRFERVNLPYWFLPIESADSPFAGFFENSRQLSERWFRLGFPLQVLMDVHCTIDLRRRLKAAPG